MVTCKICSRDFKTSQALSGHTRMIHPAAWHSESVPRGDDDSVRSGAGVLVADLSRAYHDFHYDRVADEVVRLRERVAQLEGQLYQPAALPQPAEVAEPSEPPAWVAELRDEVDEVKFMLSDLVDRWDAEGDPEAVPEEPQEAVVAEPGPEREPTAEELVRAGKLNPQSFAYFQKCLKEDVDEIMKMWGGNE